MSDAQLQKLKDMKQDEGAQGQGIVITQEQLKEVVSAIVTDYDKRLANAETRADGLRIRLEQVEAIQVAKSGEKPDRPRVRVIASYNPPDHQGLIAKPYVDGVNGKHFRFISRKPDLNALRRSQGYEPVRDEKGNEVRYIDGVLAAMPERQYQETIREPKQAKRQATSKAIQDRFYDDAEKVGLEPIGDITYDDGVKS